LASKPNVSMVQNGPGHDRGRELRVGQNDHGQATGIGWSGLCAA
jgi:hypothetical protein